MDWQTIAWHIIIPLVIAILIILGFRIIRVVIRNFIPILVIALLVWVAMFVTKIFNPFSDVETKVQFTQNSSGPQISYSESFKLKNPYKSGGKGLGLYGYSVALLVGCVAILVMVIYCRYRNR